MDPLTNDITEASQWEGIGPQPSPIAVSRLFVLQPDIDAALEATGTNENRDLNVRLDAAYINDELRKRMMLPITVFNTACVLFAKLRLDYANNNYSLQDACIAAVFLACKQEDIFKKIKEIVATAHNFFQQNNGEKVYPDDSFLEAQVKRVLQCERMLIEACRMDFRTRHPHKLALQLARQCGLSRGVALKAYYLTIDLHRTWAPLKQTAATMAIACLELAVKFSDGDHKALYDKSRGPGHYINCEALASPRYLITETMNELLDIYSFTSARQKTLVGKDYTEQIITKLKLDIVREAKDLSSARKGGAGTQDPADAVNAIKKHISKITAANAAANPSPQNGSIASPTSPATPATPSAPRGPLNPTRNIDNTLRFVLNPTTLIEERLQQSLYLPPEVIKSEVPHWYVEYSDGRKADIKVDSKSGKPMLSPNGHPLDQDGKEVKVRNSFDARRKLERQVKDGEFGKA